MTSDNQNDTAQALIALRALILQTATGVLAFAHTTVVLAPGDPSAWQIGSYNLSSRPFRVWETGALIVIDYFFF